MLSIFNRIFEKLVYKRLIKFVNEHNIFYYINTNEIPGEFSRENTIFTRVHVIFTRENITVAMPT